MKDIIDMSRQRGYFVDQSQSLNLLCKMLTILNQRQCVCLAVRIENWNVLLEKKAAVDE
jgi:hypothetical protein